MVAVELISTDVIDNFLRHALPMPAEQAPEPLARALQWEAADANDRAGACDDGHA
jgi:hypothetical protein